VRTSTTSPNEGYSRVAAATLSFDNDGKEATVAFSPVQAKLVKVRLLTTQGGERFYLTETEVMEAIRAGYTPLLARELELSRLMGSTRAAAPPAVVPATTAAPVCSPDASQSAIQPGKGESRRVLVIDAASTRTLSPSGMPTGADISLYAM
jgi:hypothetical protein